ncbi:conserved hypothetical protein [Aster yellows witches'-broom phytoplasma AYWB]|uniref:Integrase catalytic domain-containing protein n=1 Tax=Aster yellows witches'-broom phytoplasma (strain AYWB) TaxID=322098 RepID=Q2NK96_AYWBP|nr:conserved hypothetical protein [Aster yellows witches'-broom phytoplasma AYWB]
MLSFKNQKNKYHYQQLKSQLKIVLNLINQDFKTYEPMQKLFTGITYFKTQQGFLYFYCIIDSFNNQIVASHVKGFLISMSRKTTTRDNAVI